MMTTVRAARRPDLARVTRLTAALLRGDLAASDDIWPCALRAAVAIIRSCAEGIADPAPTVPGDSLIARASTPAAALDVIRQEGSPLHHACARPP